MRDDIALRLLMDVSDSVCIWEVEVEVGMTNMVKVICCLSVAAYSAELTVLINAHYVFISAGAE